MLPYVLIGISVRVLLFGVLSHLREQGEHVLFYEHETASNERQCMSSASLLRHTDAFQGGTSLHLQIQCTQGGAHLHSIGKVRIKQHAPIVVYAYLDVFGRAVQQHGRCIVTRGCRSHFALATSYKQFITSHIARSPRLKTQPQ